jgi:hypothetical protein
VVTTGPTFRLQLRLEQADAEVEAEMAKSRFDALGLTPGAMVTLRPSEFGLFPANEADFPTPVPVVPVDAQAHDAAA